MTQHVPVLLEELLELLQPKRDQQFIDATLGGGAMAHAILQHVGPGGSVIGIDQDAAALERVKKDPRLHIVHTNFRSIDSVAATLGAIHGIYFDLGISSDQLADDRGISFQDPKALLDMRMNRSDGTFSAAQLLNNAEIQDIQRILTVYGEEPRARAIARAIDEQRKKAPLSTVGDLLAVIKKVYPHTYYKRHPGTKVWQALRIVVNDELGALEEALPKAFNALAPGGKLAVISFHSLEDRIVKQFFKSLVKKGRGSLVTKKVIVPQKSELENNPRARSAKLRGIQKEK